MKNKHTTLTLCLLILSGKLFAQDIDLDMVLQLPANVQSKMTFIVTNTQACPPGYTNTISNTNLFSPAEQTMLEEALTKYNHITTNSGLAGSLQTGFKPDGVSIFWTASFQDTNTAATTRVTFKDGKVVEVDFRTTPGNGYDLHFYEFSPSRFYQYKEGKLNGLYLNFKNLRPISLMRIENQKSVGKWFQWDDHGNLTLEVEFNTPFNLGEQFDFTPRR